MDRPIIHPQYVADLLDTMRSLDPEATEKLLLLKVPVNENLRQHPTIHFYDDKLTIFGALAGMTSEEATYSGDKADYIPIIDFFNSILEEDHDAIKALIMERIPINWDLANYNDLSIVAESDSNGNAINPKLGLLGILNGLVGADGARCKIGVEMDQRGRVYRFVFAPEYKND